MSAGQGQWRGRDGKSVEASLALVPMILSGLVPFVSRQKGQGNLMEYEE